MKFRHIFSGLALSSLLLLGAAVVQSYQSTGGSAVPEKKCCERQKTCPEPKRTVPPMEESIIWETMSDNLLSARL